MVFNKKTILSFIYFFMYYSALSADNTPSFITIYVHGAQEWWLKAVLSKDLIHCPQGLHNINTLPDSSRIKEDAKRMHQIAAETFPFDHYYTFGWAGNLSLQVRQDEGFALFSAIQDLLIKYKEQYEQLPKLRIIGFSHGGNVVLNAISQLPFFIDEPVYTEIILLGCPVQKPTASFISHPHVNRCYVLCAGSDYVQNLDFYQDGYRIRFCETFFETDQDNCIQIFITINQKQISHTDFMHALMLHIPLICSKVEPFFNNSTMIKENNEITNLSNNYYKHCYSLNINDQDYIYYNIFDDKGLYGIRKSNPNNLLLYEQNE